MKIDQRRFSLDPGLLPVRVHNIDDEEASRMLGRMLNGLPFDADPLISAAPGPSDSSAPSVETNPSTPGRMVSEFMLARNTYTLQFLDNMTSSINSYIQSAAAYIYMDGSLGTKEVSASNYEDVERLAVSWPFWAVSCMSIVIALALSSWLGFSPSQ